MHNKKGQVTIFVVVAIVIVVSILLFFTLQGNIRIGESSKDVERVKTLIGSCIDKVTLETIYLISKNGGYRSPPVDSTRYGVPYYIKGNQKNIPSIDFIELEISDHLNDELFFCTKNFIDFPDLEITQKTIITKTKILPEKITFDITYPIIISKGDKSTSIKSFKHEIPVRLGIVHQAMLEMINSQTTTEICLSCNLKTAIKYDIYIETETQSGGDLLSIITDENSNINEKEFRFLFAQNFQ
ncbi:MAG: hypothetical protein IH845_03330 [Nanoarchaeota archaeon]|nr:hypothetical protein [Nanoarchaeota archaeon]